MKREVISNKQMQLFIFIYPIGSYSLFNMGAGVKQDAWIASIIGIIISMPMLFLYGRLMDLYPGKNLFELLEIVFGKFFGKILSVLFVFHIIFIGAYIFHNIMDFIKLTALWNTPIFIPMLCMILLCIWILKEGIETLWGWAKFNIRLILIFMIFTWILLIPEMQLSNLQPFFYSSFEKILNEGLSLAIYPFIESFIFLLFFDVVQYDSSTKNIFIKPVIVSGLFVTLIMMINLMLLGGNAYASFYYPGYEAMKKMHLAGSFQRMEIIVSIEFIIFRFVEIDCCLLGASKGIQKIFNLNDYRDILVPVASLLMTLAYIMFGSIMEAKEFVADLWTFYGFLLQVVLPIIIFIVALIRKKWVIQNS